MVHILFILGVNSPESCHVHGWEFLSDCKCIFLMLLAIRDGVSMDYCVYQALRLCSLSMGFVLLPYLWLMIGMPHLLIEGKQNNRVESFQTKLKS